MRFFTEADVERAVTVVDAIASVEEAFRLLASGEASQRPRQRIGMGNGAWLHVMPAAIPALGVMGFKAYATGPGGTRFMLFLFDVRTGQPLAALQASRLGQLRTGAASAVATRALARPDSRRMALIGCGYQAETQLIAIASVLQLAQVQVYCRTPGRAAAFCDAMAARVPQVRLLPAASAEAAVGDADVVVTITNSRTPVFPGTALAPGSHVNAAGSNHLARQEIDVETVRRAHRIVVDSLAQARLECGDLVAAEATGLDWAQVSELGDVLVGRRPGRVRPDEITLFESMGVAVEDVALARRVLDKGRALGLGTEADVPLAALWATG